MFSALSLRCAVHGMISHVTFLLICSVGGVRFADHLVISPRTLGFVVNIGRQKRQRCRVPLSRGARPGGDRTMAGCINVKRPGRMMLRCGYVANQCPRRSALNAS